MKAFFRINLLITLMLFATIPAQSHGDHSHAPEEPLEEQEFQTSEASNEKFEVLLRYGHIHSGEHTHLTLFISDYSTNAPISDVEVKLVLREDVKNQFTIIPQSAGIWEVEGTFNQNNLYSMAVILQDSQGRSELILEGIEIGLHSHDKAEGHTHPWYTSPIFVAILSILIGMVLMYFLQRIMGKKAGKFAVISLMILFFLPSSPHIGIAHEEVPANSGKTKNIGNSFEIQKETQFIMDMLTHEITRAQEVLTKSFFGTVIPQSSGEAQIASPQNARIVSLHTTVGSKVKAGQTLAILEGFIDATAAMELQSQRNNMEAEAGAARKEYERLQAIADIVAKKEIDEAQARLQKAQENLSLFKTKSSTLLELKSPIDGVIDNFTWSTGSSVLQGDILFTIINPEVVYIDAQMYDDVSSVITSAQSFVVITSRGEEIPASVLAVPQTLHAGNQSQHVMFTVNNRENLLKIGEFITVKALIPTTKETIVLPASAITEIDGKTVVFIKKSAEFFERQIVNIANESNSMVNVTKGLVAGDRVISNGTYQAKMIYLNR